MKLYNELGFELCFRKLFFCSTRLDLMLQSNHQYIAPVTDDVTTFCCRTYYTFKYSNFPSTTMEWNKLDVTIRRSESATSLKKSLLKLGKPRAKLTYNNHNPSGLKLLTRLRLGLSHFNEHKFKHNFRDFVNPLC